MRNLLPDDKKSLVNKEYILRVAVVSFWLFFFVVIAGVVLALPSYLMIQSQAAALHSRKGLINQTIVVREKDVSMEKLREAKSYLDHLKGASEDTRLVGLISAIGNAAPKGVDISGFVYKSGNTMSGEDNEDENGGKEKSRISIRGIAVDRNTLTSFSDSLRVIEKIDEVNLPVSQLAQGRDIEFSLTARGEF